MEGKWKEQGEVERERDRERGGERKRQHLFRRQGVGVKKRELTQAGGGRSREWVRLVS